MSAIDNALTRANPNRRKVRVRDEDELAVNNADRADVIDSGMNAILVPSEGYLALQACFIEP